MTTVPSVEVLIVDDNERNLLVLKNILDKAGISSLAVNSGKEAIRLANEQMPELILLDIMMPEVDGYTVCKELKSNSATKDIQIIFISALTSKEDILLGFESGGVDYITKPFHKDEVLARVKAQLTIKQQKVKLEESNALLKEALATKDRLFSIISHDLIGPIVNIGNVLKLLLTPGLSQEDANEFITGAIHSNSTTLDLLKNLLSWAKSQRNEIRFNPHNIDVAIIINDSINLMHGIALEKNIRIINQFPAQLTCFADENMLTLILRNLLSNALKYSQSEGRVVLSAHQDSEWLTIHVKDEGVGIHSDDIPKIFDTSQHFTTPGTAYEKGHGLGLTLCKEFAELHGGFLEVTSEPGKGSDFSVSIPSRTSSFRH